MSESRNLRGRSGSRVDSDELLAAAVCSVWRWRLELFGLLTAVAVHRMAARAGGETAATVLVAMLAAGTVAVTPARRLFWRLLRFGWLRRAWEHAATDAGLSDGPLRVPRILAARRIP